MAVFLLSAIASAVVDWLRKPRLRARLLADFRDRYGPTKDLLIVYTDSPAWAEYISTTWVPKWSQRAIILNRSKAWSRDQLEARLWLSFTPRRNHTPAAIVIPQDGQASVVTFYWAFRALSRGRPEDLQQAEARLAALLKASEEERAA